MSGAIAAIFIVIFVVAYASYRKRTKK